NTCATGAARRARAALLRSAPGAWPAIEVYSGYLFTSSGGDEMALTVSNCLQLSLTDAIPARADGWGGASFSSLRVSGKSGISSSPAFPDTRREKRGARRPLSVPGRDR